MKNKFIKISLLIALILSLIPLSSLYSSELNKKEISADIHDIFKYLDNNQGFYPENYTNNYNSNETDENIRNYNYGKENEMIYNISTDELLNFGNGYLEYGNEENGRANLKKNISSTTNDGEYEITLDIIGDEKKPRPKVDIVFVIDTSSSMNKLDGRPTGETRWKMLKESVFNFLDNLENLPIDYQLAAATYGEVSGLSGAANGSIASFAPIGSDKVVTKAYTNNIEEFKNHKILSPKLATNTGTPTALGLDLGIDLMTNPQYNSRPDANKIMINITDGGPSYYPSDKYYKNADGTYKTTAESLAQITNARRTVVNGNTLRYNAVDSLMTFGGLTSGADAVKNMQKCIDYTLPFINQRMTEIQKANKYSISLVPTDAIGGQISWQSILEALGVDGNSIAPDVESITKKLIETLGSQLDIATINKAVVSDPMSQYVEYVPDTISYSALSLNNGNLNVIQPTDEDYPEYAKNAIVSFADNKLNINNLTLSKKKIMVEKDSVLNIM